MEFTGLGQTGTTSSAETGSIELKCTAVCFRSSSLEVSWWNWVFVFIFPPGLCSCRWILKLLFTCLTMVEANSKVPLVKDIQQQLARDWVVKWQHVYREGNMCADWMANFALNHVCRTFLFSWATERNFFSSLEWPGFTQECVLVSFGS